MIKGKTKKTTIKDNPSKIPHSPFSRKKGSQNKAKHTQKKMLSPLKKKIQVHAEIKSYINQLKRSETS